MPEYHCWTLWLYDEHGIFVDNVIPEEFHQNKELMAALTGLQEQFDALYLDTPKEFTYLGFADEAAKKRFVETSYRAYELLCNAARENYDILYAIDYEDM